MSIYSGNPVKSLLLKTVKAKQNGMALTLKLSFFVCFLQFRTRSGFNYDW